MPKADGRGADPARGAKAGRGRPMRSPRWRDEINRPRVSELRCVETALRPPSSGNDATAVLGARESRQRIPRMQIRARLRQNSEYGPSAANWRGSLRSFTSLTSQLLGQHEAPT